MCSNKICISIINVFISKRNMFGLGWVIGELVSLDHPSAVFTLPSPHVERESLFCRRAINFFFIFFIFFIFFFFFFFSQQLSELVKSMCYLSLQAKEQFFHRLQK